MIEYRVRWSASSNISFRGESDWEEWSDPEATPDEIEDALCKAPGGGLCDGLGTALESSGFEWWVETRDSEGIKP